jgi:hypothetical protein
MNRQQSEQEARRAKLQRDELVQREEQGILYIYIIIYIHYIRSEQ